MTASAELKASVKRRTADTFARPSKSKTPSYRASLTEQDEAELSRFFSLDLPPVPGTSSGFGPMTERLAMTSPRNTTQIKSPTTFRDASGCRRPVVPDCEEMACEGTYGSVVSGQAEDTMIDHLDAKKKVRLVWAVLSRMVKADVDVLEARFSEATTEEMLGVLSSLGVFAGIARATKLAKKENVRRAKAGVFEAVGLTLADLAFVAKSSTCPPEDKARATAALAAIREEARTIFDAAAERFVKVRELVNPW